jgi:nitric oxide reductase subunit C
MEIPQRVFFIAFCYLTICVLVVFTSGQQNNHPMSVDVSNADRMEKGKTVWQQNGCVVCHSIYGLGGHLGPDLTNVFSRMGESYIQNIVTTGLKKMPAYTFSSTELQSLTAYFEYLDQLGKYPLNSVREEYFGNNH